MDNNVNNDINSNKTNATVLKPIIAPPTAPVSVINNNTLSTTEVKETPVKKEKEVKIKKSIIKPKEEVIKETIKDEPSFKSKRIVNVEETKNNQVDKPRVSSINDNGKKSIYLGFTARVVIYSSILVICTFLCTIFVIKSLKSNDAVVINYTEKSNINYHVYLKNNNFYESEFLDEDMIYVASLIDKVNILFNYNFAADMDIPLDFVYDVKAKVIIYDEDEKNIFFEKDYTVIEENSVHIEDGKYRSISEVVDIDYSVYNKVANEFKNTYGVETVSKLIVELNIHKNSNGVSTDITNENCTMSLSIPLSERSIGIKTDYKDINNQSSLVSDSSLTIGNIVFMIIAVILFIVAGFFAYKLIRLLLKLLPKRNLYDEFVEKTFKEYDRLVVSTTSKPDINNKGIEVIHVLTFQELLDVRDNVKAPIMYYPIHEHSKGCFYIKTDNLIYILNVKKVDLENKKKK